MGKKIEIEITLKGMGDFLAPLREHMARLAGGARTLTGMGEDRAASDRGTLPSAGVAPGHDHAPARAARFDYEQLFRMERHEKWGWFDRANRAEARVAEMNKTHMPRAHAEAIERALQAEIELLKEKMQKLCPHRILTHDSKLPGFRCEDCGKENLPLIPGTPVRIG